MKIWNSLQYHCHKAGTGRAGVCETQHSLVKTAEDYSLVPPKEKIKNIFKSLTRLQCSIIAF